jgi:hypothetical protein
MYSAVRIRVNSAAGRSSLTGLNWKAAALLPLAAAGSGAACRLLLVVVLLLRPWLASQDHQARCTVGHAAATSLPDVEAAKPDCCRDNARGSMTGWLAGLGAARGKTRSFGSPACKPTSK